MIKKLFLNQRRNQFLAVFFATLVTALTIFFALSFFTGFHAFHASSKSNSSSELLYIEGVFDFYRRAQDVNWLILNLSFLMGGFCILLYVFFTQKRRIYYLSNVIACALYSLFVAFFACFILVNCIALMSQYGNNLDWNAITNLIDRDRMSAPSNSMMYFGIALSVLMILSSVALVFNLIFKLKQKKQILQYNQKMDEMLASEALSKNTV